MGLDSAPENSRLTSRSVTIAPSIGPILGGGLTYAAGWTWIFWFLCIAAGSCLSIMIFLLPETSRNIVGNGSIRPSKHLRLPVKTIMCHWKHSDTVADHQWRMPNPLKSLTILARRDNTVVILACGLLYVIYTCINTSLSVLFIDIYNLNQWQAGLIYLPFGIGGTVSTFFSGPLLNKAYRNARTKQGLPTDTARGDDLEDFSVEKARLGVIWTPMLVTAGSVVALGWVLQYHHVRHPLCPPSNKLAKLIYIHKNSSTSPSPSACSSSPDCACSSTSAWVSSPLPPSLPPNTHNPRHHRRQNQT